MISCFSFTWFCYMEHCESGTNTLCRLRPIGEELLTVLKRFLFFILIYDCLIYLSPRKNIRFSSTEEPENNQISYILFKE